MPRRASTASSARRAAIAIAVIVGGCDRLEQAIENKVHEEVQDQIEESKKALPEPSAVPETDEEKIAVKLNLYVECTNRSRDHIRDSWARYSETVDAKTGVGKAKQKPFLHRVEGELEPCKQAVDQGPRLDPPLDAIEAAMKDYYTHALEVGVYTQLLDDYYEHEGYKDDGWEKGKELAPKFQAAFEAWDKADVALETAVEEKKDENDTRLLALIEAREGKNLRWHSQDVVLAAKLLAHCMASEGATATECEDAFAKLTSAESEFRKYHDAHTKEADAVFWMSSFASAATSYASEASALMRSLQRGKTKPEEKQRATDRYNDLVNAANNLKFDMPG